jgi:phosphate ABC transporter permease protein PstC/phosphate ABC transporter permease subunit PstA
VNSPRLATGRVRDGVLRSVLTAAAALTVGVLAWLLVDLISQSGAAFTRYGPGFVVIDHWDVPAGVFRGLGMLAGTLITSAIALVLGVPVALAAALYVSELCPRGLRAPLVLALDLLAAIPAVVYGLWGLFILAPELRGGEHWFAHAVSDVPWIGGGRSIATTNYFVAGLILAIMLVPTVSAAARQLISTVPAAARQAAASQGATRWGIICRVLLPRCRRGLAGAALLGLLSALGETVATVLLIGDNPTIGRHLFQGGDSLAAVIASELGDAVGLQRAALFAAGVLLFVLTLGVNLVARRALASGARRAGSPPPDAAGRAGQPAPDAAPPSDPRLNRTASAPRPSPARSVADRLLGALALGLALVALVPLVLVAVALIRHGAASITTSFFTQDPTGNYLGPAGGARSAILGSLELVLMAGLLSVPVGICVALYLTEYGGGHPFARMVRVTVDVMAGVPSILFGLFIYAALILGGVGGHSAAGWKGATAIALLMLAPIVVGAERALGSVPVSVREAAGAGGVPRWRVLAGGVLPAALPGLAPGVLRALAQGLGATAPLLFTVGAQNRLNVDPGRAMDSLPTLIYTDLTSTSATLQRQAWAAALVLVVLGMILHLSAGALSRRTVGAVR